MTNIEIETMTMLKSACREFINQKKKIDWEQRRYEIAKEYFVRYVNSPMYQFSTIQEKATEAVKYADVLIDELKKSQG